MNKNEKKSEINPVNNICIGRYIYKFDKKIETEVLKSLKNIDSTQLKNYGIKFSLCDVDKGSFRLSLFNKEQSDDEIHFDNTNKFANIDDKFLLPVITSDIIFLENILVDENNKYNDSVTIYRSPIKSIYFNLKNEITKIDTLNATESIIVKNKRN
jgi:hypothetical protein